MAIYFAGHEKAKDETSPHEHLEPLELGATSLYRQQHRNYELFALNSTREQGASALTTMRSTPKSFCIFALPCYTIASQLLVDSVSFSHDSRFSESDANAKLRGLYCTYICIAWDNSRHDPDPQALSVMHRRQMLMLASFVLTVRVVRAADVRFKEGDEDVFTS